MTKEPDIVRILRKEEKLGKLSFYTSIPNQYLEKCELIDKNIQTNENYEKNNFVNILTDEDSSLFSDLMDIINFTENVSTSINGDFTQNEIINIIINKFRNSNKYSGSILLLLNDGKKLQIAGTSCKFKKLKRAEKITGHNIKSFNISLEKSNIYSQVINEGKTVHFRIVDLIEELYPKKTASVICKFINKDKKMHVATPLIMDGRIIGAFAMSSTILTDYFIPSVKNLAAHVSYAFEHAKYNLEEKKVKEKLTRSEQMFRAMIERSPFGILTVDIGGWILSSNETFVKMTGYSKDELVGKNITNFPTLRKRDIPRYFKIFKEAIKGKVPKPFEIHWLNKGGSLRTGKIYVSLIKINNKITGIQAIIKDISETKETKIKLKDIEERYNSLFNSSLDLVFLCDFKGRFIDANKSALKLLGYKHEEIKKLDFSSIVDRKQILKANNVLREIKKLGYQKNVQEFKLRKKNGEYIYVGSIGSLIYHNEKPYAIQGIARDITDQKINEINIRKRSEDLELLNLVNNSINSNQNIDDIIDLISKETGKIFNSFNATIYLISKDKKYLLQKKSGLNKNDKKMIQKITGIDLLNLKIPLKERSIFSEIIKDNNPRLIKTKNEILEMIKSATDNKVLKKFAPLILQKLKIKSTMIVPLITEKGCIGLIDISSKTLFIEGDLYRFRNIAQQLTIAIDKIILKESKETSEEKYRDLYGRLRDCLVTINMDGRIIEFNSTFMELIGYSEDEIYLLNNKDITAKKWLQKEEEIIREQVIKRGYSDLYEKDYINKEGKIIPVELTTYLLRNEEGLPQGMWTIIRDISERKKAEKLIIESEEKYKSLVNMANDGIAIVKGKNIEFLNHRAASMLDYNVDELQGGEFVNYIPQEEKDKLNQRYKLRMEGKKIPHVYESQLLKKNGDILSVEINATLINYKGGPADMAIIRDITERKQMEMELEEAKNHFQRMFNTMVDPVVIVDSKGKLLEITDKVEAITGFRREELLGKNFLRTKIVTNKSKRILIKNLFKRMSGIKLKPYEIEVLTKDRNVLPFEINAAKIEYKGKSADMVVFRDVSERKLSEEALRKSEEKFRGIFEKANDGIIYLDKFGKILDVNKKAVEIFAGSEDKLIGRNFTKLDIFRAKDIPKLMSNFVKIISGKELTLEVIIKNMKNQEIHLECSGSFMKKDDKNLGLLVIARDITDRKNAEKELKEAHNRLYRLNEELEKKVEDRTTEVKKLLKQKDEFINQLGHDLKNPLNPLINLLPLIDKQIYDPNPKEQLKIVMKNVDFMKNLVIKTIELAKLNSSDIEFILEDTDLTYEVNNSIEKNQLFINDKNIEIINKINEKIITKADKLRLNELLDNLIINSIKFCTNGGFITFDGEDNGDFITISIKDTGIGLKDHQLNHIFDEFFKADKSRHDFDSSGLGLTICKRIVEKHGGTIWAESPGIGKGTTVFFTLPSYKKSDKNAIEKLNKR